MPTYIYTAPSGRRIKVTGETPPTEDQMLEIFTQAGVLGSAPEQAPTAPRSAQDEPSRTWGQTAADVGIGALKGAGNTVFGLGKLVRDYTPIGRISDAIQPGAFDQRPPELDPTNTPQKVGFGAEQIGEFFLPTGIAGKVGKVAEAAKAGSLTLAQTGSPTAAGVSGALTAVIPGAAGVKKAAGMLERGAQKSVAQSLGASKEWAKSEAATLAPDILRRGAPRGTHASMLARAESIVESTGKKIGAEVAAVAKTGQTVNGHVIQGEVQLARDGLMELNAAGVREAIPGTEIVIRQLDRLEKFVGRLGPDIPFDQAQRIKIVWDRIVDKAGLYGQKATASATDSSKAWAIREGSGSFRQLLADGSATLKDLNKEFKFWKGIEDVLQATKLRTQAQGGGIVSGISGVTAAASAYGSGGDLSDILLAGAAGRQFVKAMQSPWWRSQASAPFKHMLADALASGSAERIARATQKIVSSLPAQAVP